MATSHNIVQGGWFTYFGFGGNIGGGEVYFVYMWVSIARNPGVGGHEPTPGPQAL